jgi:hypothetical protein
MFRAQPEPLTLLLREFKQVQTAENGKFSAVFCKSHTKEIES